jgi:hypothetical protein
MKKFALILLAAVSLVGTVGAASAQWYGGGGYYDDHGPSYRHRYRERYYDDDNDRYYRRRYYGERRGYRTLNGCPPHYTIQDGECKPYRGY